MKKKGEIGNLLIGNKLDFLLVFGIVVVLSLILGVFISYFVFKKPINFPSTENNKNLDIFGKEKPVSNNVDNTKKDASVVNVSNPQVERRGSGGGGGGGSGGGGSSDGTTPVPGCAPNCDGKTCGDDGCGGFCGTCNDNNECTSDVCSSGACSFSNLADGAICSRGICRAGICVSCTTDSECNDNIACTNDRCSSGACVNSPDNSKCSTGEICDNFYGCVPEIHITNEWLASRGNSPYILDQDGATYILETNVTTEGTAFLINANDITFDLNGYTITYADMDFTGVENPGFEIAGTSENVPYGWDLSGAHGHAYRQSYEDKLMFDNYSLLIVNYAGDSYTEEYVLSSPVYLPKAGKYAITAQIQGGPYGILDSRLEVDGINAPCDGQISNMPSTYGGDMALGMICEFDATEPATVRAKIIVGTNNPIQDVSLNVDEVDIRPISDNTGMNYGEVGNAGIAPYTWNFGMREIKNGKIIEGRSKSVYSPAIGRTAATKIHDLTIITNGINSKNILEYWQSNLEIYNNYMEANGKLPLHRHYLFAMIEMGRSEGGNKIYNNILMNGPHAGINIGGSPDNWNEIYNNTIKLKNIATNGFSIAASYSNIYDNKIQPYQGHGIGGTTGLKIYNNLIEPKSWPCSEYSSYLYPNSAHGIRLKNYGGGYGGDIDIFNNTIIGSTNYQLPGCYTEVVGITNYMLDEYSSPPTPTNISIHDNYIDMRTDNYLQQHAIAYKAMGYGNFYNNTLKSNHVIIELSDLDASESSNLKKLVSNTLIKPDSNLQGSTTLRNYGYFRQENYLFLDTKTQNGASLRDISLEGNNLNYSVANFFYTNIKDNFGNNVNDVTVKVYDKNKTLIYEGKTDSNGNIPAEIVEYYYNAPSSSRGAYVSLAPYTLKFLKPGYVPKDYSLLSINQSISLNFFVDKESDTCLANDMDGDGYGTGCLYGSYDCDNNNANVNPGAYEVCNGIDDNCDGNIDEVSILGTTTCGLGICRHTINNCQGGVVQTCNPLQGQQTEICENSIDENCDGYDSLCDTMNINLITPNGQNFGSTVSLSGDVSDTKGVSYVSLYSELNGNLTEVDRSYSGRNYIWLEAEDFNFDSNYWQICDVNDDCESNYYDYGGGASNGKHIVSDDNNGGVSFYPNMSLNVYFDSGTYYLWARSYGRGGEAARRWNVSLNGKMSSQSFGDQGSGYTWENGGGFTINSPGYYTVYIIDASPDGYWAYPDAVLFAKNSSYNPSTNCGNDVSNFGIYTGIYEKYSNYNCKLLTTNNYQANFILNGVSSGTYKWGLKGVSDANLIEFSENRSFSVS